MHDVFLDVMHQLVHLNDLISNGATISLMLLRMHILAGLKESKRFAIRFIKSRVVAVVVEHIQAQAIHFNLKSS